MCCSRRRERSSRCNHRHHRRRRNNNTNKNICSIEEEEEYEEVTIPSESELKAMTKTGILAQGAMLDFKLDIKDTKAGMIASFLTQVDEFIASLQESGEFVSAEDDEGENDNPNIQDGGYF